jgi:hypothetical protein
MFNSLSASITKRYYGPPRVVREYYGECMHSDPSALKIVIVLDESGSMEPIRHQMIGAINDLITEQKKVVGKPATFTLVKFNENINRVMTIKPLKDVNLLTNASYTPSGSTALYDAIGDTIDRFYDVPNVLMVIVTDGQENASKRYKKYEIESLIETQKSKYGWTYVYLSNDLSTFSQGNGIGLKESATVTNKMVDQSGYGKFIGATLNSAIGNYRSKGVSVQSQL